MQRNLTQLVGLYNTLRARAQNENIQWTKEKQELAQARTEEVRVLEEDKKALQLRLSHLQQTTQAEVAKVSLSQPS